MGSRSRGELTPHYFGRILWVSLFTKVLCDAMSIKAHTLDSLIKAAGEAIKVIELKYLEPNYALAVVTQNETEYDIIVLEPQTGRVLVK